MAQSEWREIYVRTYVYRGRYSPFLTERPKRLGKVSASHRRRDRWWREAWRSIDRRCDFPSFFTPDQRHPPSRTLSLSPSSCSRPPPPLRCSLGRPTFTLLAVGSSAATFTSAPLPSQNASRQRHSPSRNGPSNASADLSAPFFPFSLLSVFPLLAR